MNIFRTVDAEYTADVEIDEHGRVVYLRDFAPGETIHTPYHMLRLIMCTGKPTIRSYRVSKGE